MGHLSLSPKKWSVENKVSLGVPSGIYIETLEVAIYQIRPLVYLVQCCQHWPTAVLRGFRHRTFPVLLGWTLGLLCHHMCSATDLWALHNLISKHPCSCGIWYKIKNGLNGLSLIKKQSQCSRRVAPQHSSFQGEVDLSLNLEEFKIHFRHQVTDLGILVCKMGI